jgi:hypothetical protein
MPNVRELEVDFDCTPEALGALLVGLKQLQDVHVWEVAPAVASAAIMQRARGQGRPLRVYAHCFTLAAVEEMGQLLADHSGYSVVAEE